MKHTNQGRSFIFLALTCLSFFGVAALTPAAANSKYAAIVIHADTGDILFDKYSTQRRYPASLTKIMTLYLLFEELEAGRLDLSTTLTASNYAASMPASDLGLRKGDKITVEQAINALVIKSANDVAVVVAEKIGGTESAFAKKMTNKAWSMGMKSTRFRNASGLPNSKQYTTARDLAILSQRMRQDFPQYWSYFQKDSFSWKGDTIKSHNKLIGKFDGADGLKTGYTRMSGYNLATTVTRGDNRLIGVVLGGRSGATRDAHMRKIIDEAYSTIRAKPYLISAIHRVKPTPNLKPTTLAEVGGVWPPAPTTLASADDFANAPTIGGSSALQFELASEAAGLVAGGNGIEVALAESVYATDFGEGDAERDGASNDLTWAIQTGAYSSRDWAIKELTKVNSLYEMFLTNASPEISEVRVDGQAVYRVRFHYLTQSQSADACTAIVSNGGGCFVMRQTEFAD